MSPRCLRCGGGPEWIEAGDDPKAKSHKWRKPTKTVRWPHCAVCGIIRRADGKNKPECPGTPRVTLRKARGAGRKT